MNNITMKKTYNNRVCRKKKSKENKIYKKSNRMDRMSNLTINLIKCLIT